MHFTTSHISPLHIHCITPSLVVRHARGRGTCRCQLHSVATTSLGRAQCSVSSSHATLHTLPHTTLTHPHLTRIITSSHTSVHRESAACIQLLRCCVLFQGFIVSGRTTHAGSRASGQTWFVCCCACVRCVLLLRAIFVIRLSSHWFLYSAALALVLSLHSCSFKGCDTADSMSDMTD